ncbi:HdeD family acid-resistance protein [Kitasatospora kifunensis]|uniref:Uncharacterized membrane protein HdeD (DUF308 family) n=1 Tax=Kitasatospora kifunensis TaxID=58351 RepID=A0A7W7R130_KITKI|nr:DUF308 domain-containing protein [Kitasatospora kifunensis]MBB4923258.1 uncharacterized membrane protein HdeD (DUF308 family) [Kitasatospora kifunensis]
MTHFANDPLPRPLEQLARSAWQALLLAGVAAALLGVLVLAWPQATLLVVGVLFGLFLLVSGLVQLAAAFGTHTATALRVMAFISGALSIVLGLFCFRGTLESILLLGLWIGIGWLFRGITQVMAAASDPGTPARGWMLLLGVINALAGIVLISWPIRSVTVLTVVTGCWLVAVGVVEAATALRLRHVAKQLGSG